MTSKRLANLDHPLQEEFTLLATWQRYRFPRVGSHRLTFSFVPCAINALYLSFVFTGTMIYIGGSNSICPLLSFCPHSCAFLGLGSYGMFIN